MILSNRQSSYGPQEAFQRHLAEGRFMIQRSVDTGIWIYHPRSVAPTTGDDLEWAKPSGLGTVIRPLVSASVRPSLP